MSLFTSEFAMKDLGPLSYFLGVTVTRHNGGLFLCQKTYAEEIIERVAMVSCKPAPTPVDTKGKLAASSNSPYHDPQQYRNLAGAFNISPLQDLISHMLCNSFVSICITQ